MTDGVHTAQVGYERAMYALKTLPGKSSLQSFKIAECGDLSPFCKIEPHIVVHALDVENIVEVNTNELVLYLYHQTMVALYGVNELIIGKCSSYLLVRLLEVVKANGFEQIVNGSNLDAIKSVFLVGCSEDQSATFGY